MSKFAEQLRAIKVYNNWELLSRFGTKDDVAIEYHRPARGRLGWAEFNKTSVWSPHINPKLAPKQLSRGTEKIFHGLRRDSLPQALAWASAEFGHDYVPSPFGGYIPKHVRQKAEYAVRNQQDCPPLSGNAQAGRG